MKNDITLNIGGKLTTGDVVGIAYNNCTWFGWYVEPGQYGSLKYMSFTSVNTIKKNYDDFVNANGQNVSNWEIKKFSKGLTYKCFYRDFITTFGPTNNRAFKINNPEEFFKGAGDTEQNYLKGRDVLRSINFPAK